MDNTDIMLYEKKGNIALITFNRPKALNALSSAVSLKVVELINRAEADDEIKVIVLTGAGEKAFVAGGDIKEMYELNAMQGRAYAIVAKKAVDALWKVSKPVIAAINGLCLGGGMEYAMACDLRIASEKAKFGQLEINIGVMPGSGGTQRLPRLIGLAKAKEFCFTGDMFDAKQALDLGLINYVYPAESLMDETMKLAEKIAAKSAPALKLIKSAMNLGTEIDVETASIFEIDCFGLCFSTEEQKQKMRAFVEKK
jgi:enoyl-CoA hydratase